VPPELKNALSQVSTASIASALLKLGLRNVWIRGAMPVAGGGSHRVGLAFTMRFLPMREDLVGPSLAKLGNSRAAVEAMEEDSFAVIDAMGVTDAGVAGDVLCARMVLRGVAGLVTDGAVPDSTVATVNAILRTGPGAELRRAADGELRRELRVDLHEDAALLPWLLADAGARLLVGDRAKLLRRCANHDTCVLVFLDTSRSRTRRWCSMELCGNRSKVAAHARRRRADEG